ncbi:hypothetical protein GCM10010377_76220 [Streptomyces viridiviolaceus]|nr:hypothetical protein GCM10010377_76220 [Streptomyces viridiviolaceus]
MAGRGGKRFWDTAICLPGEVSCLGALSAHLLLSAEDTRVSTTASGPSAEARREAANAGEHDRVHEIFSSTGRTVRPR